MIFFNRLKDKYRVIDTLPSVLLALSFFLGGMRKFDEWAVFSLIFIGVFLFFRENIRIEKISLWLIFGLWILVSVFFSHAPMESFWQFSKYLLFILFFCFTASRGKEALKIWVVLVFSFALISAVIVFYQYPAFNLPLPENPNYTAAFFAACAAALVLILTGVRSIKVRVYAAVALLIFISAMIMVGSRGALLSFVIVSLAILIYKKYYRAFIVILFLMAIAVIIAPLELIGGLLKIYDPNSFQRLNIWKTAIEGIYFYPIWGYGAGGFENLFSQLKFPAYDGFSYFGHYARHAHSEILNIAATSGIAAAFIFIGAFIKSLKFEANNNVYIDIVRVFAIVVFLQSCVDMIFHLGSLNLLFFGSLGFISSFSKFKKNKKDDKIGKGILFFVAIVLLFSLYIKQRDNALRDCALNCSEPAVKMTALKKVRKFNKGGEVLLFESVKTKLLFNSNYALAAASARHGEKLYPLSWRFKFIQAEIYFKTLNYLRAKEKIKDVLLIEPNCLSAKFRLSEILYEEGEFKAAFKEVLAIEKILKNLKALNPSGYNKALLRFNRDKYNKFKKQIWKMKKSGKIIV